MTHIIDMNLLAVAAQLGPRIAEQSAIGERDRWAPQAVADRVGTSALTAPHIFIAVYTQ